MTTALILKFIGLIGMISGALLGISSFFHQTLEMPFFGIITVLAAVFIFIRSFFLWTIGVALCFLAEQTELLKMLVMKPSFTTRSE